jgi:hypothetical protein
MTSEVKVLVDDNGALKPGDRFTIAGYGLGRKGERIAAGVNLATGRKMNVHTLTVFIAEAPIRPPFQHHPILDPREILKAK